VAAGIENEQVQMTMLVLVLNGWPVWVGLAFILLPFMLGTRRLMDWWLLLCAIFVMGAWTLYEATGLAYGPRYWYEALPFLMLLTARGAQLAAVRLADVAGALRRRFDRAEASATWPAYAVVTAVLAVLILTSLYAWSFPRSCATQVDPSNCTERRPGVIHDVTSALGIDGLGVEPWRVFGVPRSAAALASEDLYPSGGRNSGFGYLDGRAQGVVNDADLENALVLVQQDCPGTAWYCYGSVFWRNAPDLDGNVVYARYLVNRLPELFAQYPDRSVYVLSYTYGDLVPYGGQTRTNQNAPRQGVEPDDVPVAAEITPPVLTPTPTASPTPTPAPTETSIVPADAQ
jgi:hypothetical protein